MSVQARLRFLYLAYHAIGGAFLPYFSVYLRTLGLDDRRIGATQVLGALAGGPAAVLWARLGREAGSASAPVKLAVLAASPLLLLPWVSSTTGLTLLLLVDGLSLGAMMSLIDTTTTLWARANPGASYSRIRMFGSFGFVAAALTVGWLLDTQNPEQVRTVVLGAILGGLGLTAVTSLSLPRVADPAVASKKGEARELLKDKRLLLLVFAFTLHSASCIPYSRLFGLYVSERGLSMSLTGIATAVGVISEGLGFWMLPSVLKRWRRTVVLLFSFGVTALRWLVLGATDSPWLVVGLQVLHGATFGLFWGTALQLCARLVPARLRSTAVAVLGAFVFAVGDAVGLGLVTLLAPALGVSGLYTAAAGLELVPLICAAVLYRWLDSADARKRNVTDLFGDETTNTGVA